MTDASDSEPRTARPKRRERLGTVVLTASLVLSLCVFAVMPPGRRIGGSRTGAAEKPPATRPPVDPALFYRVKAANLALLQRYNTPYTEADLRHIRLTIADRNSQSVEVTIAGRPTIRHISISNRGVGPLRNPRIEIYPYVFPELRDLGHIEAIVDQKMRTMPDRDKADYLFWVVRNYHIHAEVDWRARPSDPVVLVNVLGHGMCVEAATAFVRLAMRAGMPARVVHLSKVPVPEGHWPGGHTVAEVYFDGAWHMYDPDFAYFFERDGRVLSLREIQEDPGVITRTFRGHQRDPLGVRVADLVEVYGRATATSPPMGRVHPVEMGNERARARRLYGFRPRPRTRHLGSAPYRTGDFPRLGSLVGDFLSLSQRVIPVSRCHSMDYELLPGETITFFTGKVGRCHSGGRQGPPPFYANGRLATPLAALRPHGERVLPYPITQVATRPASAASSLDVSFDSGLTWVPLTDGREVERWLANTHPYRLLVRGRGAAVKTATQLLIEFQVAPLSLPRLKRGHNLVRWLAAETSFHPITATVDIAYTEE